jgi:uncharacterized protein (UPF0548 family)
MRLVQPRHVESMGRYLHQRLDAVPTYADFGATLRGTGPAGFRRDHYEIDLGSGDAIFERGVLGLKTWQAHRIRGVRVFPADAEVRTGVTVVVSLGLPVLALAAPCRIVGVVDEPGRWGFAYGTLPDHPEQGEEAFCVSQSAGGSVQFDITAFSRPGSALVRLAGPIGRSAQSRGAKGYLAALQRFVQETP